mgnify:CR=1 FL=1
MRVMTVVQGRYGSRITANIRAARVTGWTVTSWTAPRVLPPVIDYPCLAAFIMDAVCSDTLMHVSGQILVDEATRNVKPFRAPVHTLRPQGRNE